MHIINVTSAVTQDLPIGEWTWSLRKIIVLIICCSITLFTILGLLKFKFYV